MLENQVYVNLTAPSNNDKIVEALRGVTIFASPYVENPKGVLHCSLELFEKLEKLGVVARHEQKERQADG